MFARESVPGATFRPALPGQVRVAESALVGAEERAVELQVPVLSNGNPAPFPAVFIRAPILRTVDEEAGAITLARLEDGTAVAARQANWLVTSFHPELTGDDRFHQYFIQIVEAANDS